MIVVLLFYLSYFISFENLYIIRTLCPEGTPKGYKLRIQNTGMNIPIIIGGCLTGTAWLVVFFLVK